MGKRTMKRDDIQRAAVRDFPGRDKGAALVVSDSGNDRLKAVNADGREINMPHRVERLSDQMWARQVARAKYDGKMVGFTQKLSILNRETKEAEHYIIGDEAAGRRRGEKLGSDKYEEGYFPALLAAQLMTFYPDGHDHVILAIAHPPSEIEHIDLLVKLVGGTHRIKTHDGRKIKFVVRRVIPFDEPKGGVAWMNIRTAGAVTSDEYGRIDLPAGTRILTGDIGGWLGSMGPAIVNEAGLAIPIWHEYQPINQGIINTFQALQAELKSLPELRGMKSIPEHMLSEALQTGHMHIGGESKPRDVREMVTAACTIIDEIESIYENFFDAGRPYRMVALSGGAIRDLYNPLKEVIRHEGMRPVDSLSQIVMANARGGLEIALSTLEALENGKN